MTQIPSCTGTDATEPTSDAVGSGGCEPRASKAPAMYESRGLSTLGGVRCQNQYSVRTADITLPAPRAQPKPLCWTERTLVRPLAAVEKIRHRPALHTSKPLCEKPAYRRPPGPPLRAIK